MIESITEYIRLLSDSYLRGHVLPKEEAIQVRSPSLYFTLNRDYPAGYTGRNLFCGVGAVNLPENFGQLSMMMDGNKTALFVIDALVMYLFLLLNLKSKLLVCPSFKVSAITIVKSALRNARNQSARIYQVMTKFSLFRFFFAPMQVQVLLSTQTQFSMQIGIARSRDFI